MALRAKGRSPSDDRARRACGEVYGSSLGRRARPINAPTAGLTTSTRTCEFGGFDGSRPTPPSADGSVATPDEPTFQVGDYPVRGVTVLECGAWRMSPPNRPTA